MGWRPEGFGAGGVVAVGVCVIMAGWPSYAHAGLSVGGTQRAPHILFSIDVPRIKESSSLVVSTAHPGLVYTANDSGDGPFVYVLNRAGHLVGTTTLAGVHAVDIEAMAGGADGSLVVGDIGDNRGDRDNVEIYRIPQPTAGDHTVNPEKVTLTYADGSRNAESILYDAGSGRVLVVSKELLAHVYTTPPDVFSFSSAKLTQVAGAPVIATDATFLPGHRAVVVRTYRRAYVYRYPSWRPVTSFVLPAEQQGESIASVPGRAVVWVGSEGVDSPVWDVPLPAAVAGLAAADGGSAGGLGTPPATGHAPSGSAHHATGDGAGPSWAASVVRVSGSAGVLVVAVGAVVLLSRTRRSKAPPS